MDCRKALVCALSLLVLISGCQTPRTPQNQTGLTGHPNSSDRSPLPLVQSRKSSDEDPGPRRNPKPATLVAAGDLHARSALAPETTDQKKAELYDTARRAYQQALQIDPNYLPAQMGLARAYVGLNDLPKARTAYELALRIAPKNSVAWHDLSVVCLREKNGDAAISCLQKAIENEPENRTYQNTMAWTLARLGRTEDAVGLFAKLHGEAKAHFKVAQMMNHMQQGDAARKHLEAALARDPQMDEARNLLTKMDSPVPQTPAPIRPVQHTTPLAPAQATAHQAIVPVYGEPMADPQVSVPEAPPSYLVPLELAPPPMSRTEVKPQDEPIEAVVLLPPPPRAR